jgi:hypothetical protein
VLVIETAAGSKGDRALHEVSFSAVVLTERFDLEGGRSPEGEWKSGSLLKAKPSEAERAWNDELWPVLVIETAAGSEGRSGASRGEFFPKIS